MSLDDAQRVLGRHTGTVLRAATTLIRAGAVVIAAAALFTGPAAHGPARVAELVCFAVGTATVIAWGVLARRRQPSDPARTQSRLLVVFAIMATGSAACTSPHGGELISFALLAAVGAGAAGTVGSAGVVAAVGVLAITSGAVAAGAGAVGTVGDCLEVVVALLLGCSRRSYRIRSEQAALLLAQSEQLRAEQAQVATLNERARIAREIHDVLAHSLGALNIQIQAARALVTEQDGSSPAVAVLTRAQRIATEGLDETRRAVQALRTDRLPLDQELDTLAAAHRRTHSVPVAVEVRGDVRPLPPEASVALLRTAQESLVNAAKHSPGQPVTLELTYDAGRTHLSVTNPLQAAGPVPDVELATVDGGYGLLGMRERLLLLHGSLSAAARAGRWEVSAEVPR